MKTIKKGSTEIELCEQCGGIWCEAGELAAIAGTKQDLPPQSSASVEGLRAYCPTCECPLNRRYYSDRRQVLIDECTACKGVWLDQNELSDIVKMVHQLNEV